MLGDKLEKADNCVRIISDLFLVKTQDCERDDFLEDTLELRSLLQPWVTGLVISGAPFIHQIQNAVHPSIKLSNLVLFLALMSFLLGMTFHSFSLRLLGLLQTLLQGPRKTLGL